MSRLTFGQVAVNARRRTAAARLAANFLLSQECQQFLCQVRAPADRGDVASNPPRHDRLADPEKGHHGADDSR
jgi:ABC-type uncharacterized transport system YnjBCD substrate-binding protein